MAIYKVDGEAISTIFNTVGNELESAYAVNGEYVHYVPSLTLLHSILESSLSESEITPQGFAAYGDYYFQFFTGDNKMRIFNKSTYALAGEYSATDIKHANTMQFGTAVQDTGFPLLYVSEWGDSGSSDSKTIDVLKVSLSGYQKVDSFTLPNSAGYHPSFVVDWTNNIGYSVGFADSLSTTTEQPNVITKYDFSDMSILEQYQVPYMGVLNGWEYYKGQLIYCGNTWNGSAAIFSFIDTSTHEVVPYSIAKTTDEEYEGYAVFNGELICSNWIRTNNVLYYRIFSMNLP